MGMMQSEREYTYVLDPQEFLQSAVRMKVDHLEEQVLDLSYEINDMKDWIFLEKGEKKERFSLENERKSADNITFRISGEWEESKKIVTRSMEILSEWEEKEDIRIQVQYAALLVGKIDNLKKKDIICSNDVKKKICTLLRNVIRLNAVEELLSREQLYLLREGFSAIIAENIQKEDLLQLNRKFRKAGLQTMPAWE